MKDLLELVKKIKETGNILKKLLRERMEIGEKLQKVEDEELLKSLREELLDLDLKFEELKFEYQGNMAIANLVTGLLNAGKLEDVELLLADDVLSKAAVKVLEVRKGKSAGTVRAWCEDTAGKKAAVYAKNEAAKTLTSAVGKQIEVLYKKLDKGYFAVKVSLPESENDSKVQKMKLIEALYQS